MSHGRTFLPIDNPHTDLASGMVLSHLWREWYQGINKLDLDINALPGQNRWNFADQPLDLAPDDAGYVADVLDYSHRVRWTGTVWEFAPGDPGNGFRGDFAIVPQTPGWALMDGSVTDYLVVGGATLTVAAYTTPNLTGSPAFHKSAAAYTGTIEAAIAAALSGHTATLVGVSGETGGMDLFGFNVDAGVAETVIDAASNFFHYHELGTLAADAAARPPSIGWLPYFRR